MFIFERRRNREWVGEGQRQTHTHTESKAGSRLWAVSAKPDVGLKLTNCEIMTWTEVRCLTDWATQVPQASSSGFRLRSWSQSHGIKHRVGLCMELMVSALQMSCNGSDDILVNDIYLVVFLLNTSKEKSQMIRIFNLGTTKLKRGVL